MFDLILMDINMPVMDGFEASEIIRKSFPKESGTIILAVTGDNPEAIEKERQNAGIDQVIEKPLNVQ